jgi:hypothetical protein
MKSNICATGGATNLRGANEDETAAVGVFLPRSRGFSQNEESAQAKWQTRARRRRRRAIK